MTTAILSALPEEQAGLLAALEQPQRVAHAGRAFWRGALGGKDVVLALSGIGKVAAATTATAAIERFGAARIVFTGVAGGVGDGVHVGDVVVARDYLQHDMDASPLFARWELPGYARTLVACDAHLSALLLEAANDCVTSAAGQFGTQCAAHGVHHGLVASGDRFIAAAAEAMHLRSALRNAGHDVLAVEMEGAAVAQVCLDYGLPFAAVRTISDRADDDAHGDFTLFVRTVASRYTAQIVQALVQKL
ncbi:MAG: 5'-methylthioadenosine/adenosylhomocysteine nucleosidase [Acidovorax sp.]|uniref:5'-methylthioadenosine/adenosylhomocysteine nucleosidase n=1 Tax=Acidovorax sp. TaxID=1872122 RepID=UPI0039E455A9